MDQQNDEMNFFMNAPNFPGQQVGGLSIEKIRGFIKRQKRIMGFTHSAPVGQSTLSLKLSGNARIFLGLAVFGRPTTLAPAWVNFLQIETAQLTINNEIIIEQTDPNFLTPQFNNNEYYYIPRPLSGTDEITMNFNNAGSSTEIVKVAVYYI